jgi:hypothetical protein
MTPRPTLNPEIPAHSGDAFRRAPEKRTAGRQPAARRKVLLCLRTYITVTVAP